MSYGGESIAKKWARLVAWRQLVTSYKHYHAPHWPHPEPPTALVLSGPHGYDVRVARALGVGNIVAVDTDRAALQNAKDENELQGVSFVHARAEDVLQRQNFDIVLLDFCATVEKAVPDIVSRLADLSTDKGLVLNGRVVSSRYHAIVRPVFLGIAGMYGRDRTSAPKSVTAAQWRSDRAHDLLIRSAKQTRTACYEPALSIAYKSDRKDRRGVPMLYVCGQLQRFYGRRSDASRAARKAYRQMSKAKIENPIAYDIGSRKADEELRNIIFDFREAGASAQMIASFLCLSPGTVAAYFAHETRGTYNAENRSTT